LDMYDPRTHLDIAKQRHEAMIREAENREAANAVSGRRRWPRQEGWLPLMDAGEPTHGSAKNDPLATVLSVVALVVIVLALPAVIVAGAVLMN
jgi:hypothetical protein